MKNDATARKPTVAGFFYSDDGDDLMHWVERLLGEAEPYGSDAPKAIIAPHAGFIYSGLVAATAYSRLRRAAGCIRRVVIVGPSHAHPFRGIAAPSVDAFETPMGLLPVDAGACEMALAQPGVQVLDRAHAREHSIETQLPFIQRALGDVSIVPLVVGESTVEEVGRVLQALWGGPETAIVISSDLSHFHDDAEAREIDRKTAKTIEALKADSLGPEDACGFLPIAGLLWNASRLGARVRTLELRNSSDAGAPPGRVVGYGAFEFTHAA